MYRYLFGHIIDNTVSASELFLIRAKSTWDRFATTFYGIENQGSWS